MSKDEFRILIASDIHLGYNEKDAIRGNDSFDTFEEVLQVAVAQKVDFLLLGGDLFHENKPSTRSLTKCIDLLRKYSLGDDQVCFQVVSDQQVNFAHSSSFQHVNFEDANLNVSLPVFSIHGNHDDPNTKDAVSVLDTLAATGLVNYFGKQTNMDALRVSPVMLVKGKLQLALYGIGSLPEERFHRYIAGGKVQFLAMEQPDEWFKIFVVHQNRVKHGNKYLPEHCLTDLPDFVVWGHEHESCTKADFNAQNNFYVYQPGSTVATSMCPGECAPKHVGLLTVRRNQTGDFCIKLDPIRLTSVRPFYFETHDLDAHFAQIKIKTPSTSDVEEYCLQLIEQLLDKDKQERLPKQPELPLIRIRLETSDASLVLSGNHFAQKTVNRVANAKDVLLFKVRRDRNVHQRIHMDMDLMDNLTEDAKLAQVCGIDDVIQEYFEQVDSDSQLHFLYEKLLTESVRECVEKDICRMQSVIDWHLNQIQDKFLAPNVPLSRIVQDTQLVREMAQDFKEKLKQDEQNNLQSVRKLLKLDTPKKAAATQSRTKAKSTEINDQDSEDEILQLDSSGSDHIDTSPVVRESKSTRGRSTGRGRGRPKASSTRGRAKASDTSKGKSISDYMCLRRQPPPAPQ